MANVLMDFWAAGMETTTTTMRWALVLLIKHPEVQAKVQKEIDDVIGPNRQPTMADRPNMPYTSATLLELQRRVILTIAHSILTRKLITARNMTYFSPVMGESLEYALIVMKK